MKNRRRILPVLAASLVLAPCAYGEQTTVREQPPVEQPANAVKPAAVAKPAAEQVPTVQQARKAYESGRYEEAFIIVEPLAKMDHPDAEYLLGEMYALGRGVRQNTEKAVELFTSAASHGCAAAQNRLGQLQMEGKKDYASAMSWFRKAAGQGDALAYSAIGDLYANGYGVDRNEDKAMEYYRKAAAAGDAGACLRLGRLYEQGKEVKADRPQALFWYWKGAALGNAACSAAVKRLGGQTGPHSSGSDFRMR